MSQPCLVHARNGDWQVIAEYREQRSRFRSGDSFLITRSLDNTEPLSQFIERTFATLDPARQMRIRRRLARELGKLIARMHDAGIVHHDLHAANLLISLTPDDRP